MFSKFDRGRVFGLNDETRILGTAVSLSFKILGSSQWLYFKILALVGVRLGYLDRFLNFARLSYFSFFAVNVWGLFTVCETGGLISSDNSGGRSVRAISNSGFLYGAKGSSRTTSGPSDFKTFVSSLRSKFN